MLSTKYLIAELGIFFPDRTNLIYELLDLTLGSEAIDLLFGLREDQAQTCHGVSYLVRCVELALDSLHKCWVQSIPHWLLVLTPYEPYFEVLWIVVAVYKLKRVTLIFNGLHTSKVLQWLRWHLEFSRRPHFQLRGITFVWCSSTALFTGSAWCASSGRVRILVEVVAAMVFESCWTLS